jgi:serine protease Do
MTNSIFRLSVATAALLLAFTAALSDDLPGAPLDSARALAEFATQLSGLLAQGRPVAIEPLRQQLAPYRTCLVPLVSPGNTDRPAEELYARTCDSVVIVGKLYKCDKCSNWHVTAATGFVLSSGGVICTNYHVLGTDTSSQAIGVMSRDGRVFAIEKVLACSQYDDLLVLQTAARGLPPLPVAENAPIGSHVYCLGHPSMCLYTLTEGMVAGYYQRANSTDMAITADFARGSSGSPILTSTGAVVGIARATSPVYYDANDKTNSYVQMVWKYCVPSVRLLALVR